jgi:hypothetical protein
MEHGEQGPLDIHQYIALMLDQMAGIAWQKLGLHPDPITGTTHTDLAQAKVAIDLCGHLAGLIHPRLDPADQRQIDNLLNDLRANYMQRT